MNKKIIFALCFILFVMFLGCSKQNNENSQQSIQEYDILHQEDELSQAEPENYQQQYEIKKRDYDDANVSVTKEGFVFNTGFVGTQETIFIYDYVEKNTEVYIPQEIQNLPVGVIFDYAFQGRELTHINIPENVIYIHTGAFRDNRLSDITIPDMVVVIGSEAFWNNQLTSIVIPSNVRDIEAYAFSFNQLTSLVIPDNVKKIGSDAFSHNQLDNIIISNSVTKIESFAFANNQLASIIIPDNVISIEVGAFFNNQLTSITIGENVKLEHDLMGNMPFDDEFDIFYLENGSKAGTYILSNGSWGME